MTASALGEVEIERRIRHRIGGDRTSQAGWDRLEKCFLVGIHQPLAEIQLVAKREFTHPPLGPHERTATSCE